MGCKQSKGAGRIQPVGPAEVRRDNSRLRKCLSEQNTEYEIDNRTGRKISMRRTKSQKSTKSHLTGSCGSLDSQLSHEDSPRGQSASSKVSKQSSDSGLGEEYAHVITEFSSDDKIRKIEEEFVENTDLDLGICGTAVPVRTSAKDRERLQEAMILQALREEGLISRPQAQGASGLSFEITEQNGIMKRPPPRLEKLEKRKKKKTLTEEEIREKLERAERRKRKREQERLEKIKEKEKSNPNDALEAFVQMQREKEEQVNKKIDTVADNREKRLREIQEKLKEKQRRAELVRKRKQLATLEGENQNDEEIPTGKQLDRA